MSRIPLRWVALAGALVLVGAFLTSLTRTLQSIDRREAHLVALQRQANAGLARLEPKVQHLRSIRTKAAGVSETLKGVGSNLAATSDAVGTLGGTLDGINARLLAVSGAVRTLDGRVQTIATQISALSASLNRTAGNVATLTADTRRIATALSSFTPALRTVNSRLSFVNSTVGELGRDGVTTQIGLKVHLGTNDLGTAKITAVLIPTGAWR
jgi:chromosome segregation ATPase